MVRGYEVINSKKLVLDPNSCGVLVFFWDHVTSIQTITIRSYPKKNYSNRRGFLLDWTRKKEKKFSPWTRLSLIWPRRAVPSSPTSRRPHGLHRHRLTDLGLPFAKIPHSSLGLPFVFLEVRPHGLPFVDFPAGNRFSVVTLRRPQCLIVIKSACRTPWRWPSPSSSAGLLNHNKTHVFLPHLYMHKCTCMLYRPYKWGIYDAGSRLTRIQNERTANIIRVLLVDCAAKGRLLGIWCLDFSHLGIPHDSYLA
jgi:hypothetical protein